MRSTKARPGYARRRLLCTLMILASSDRRASQTAAKAMRTSPGVWTNALVRSSFATLAYKGQPGSRSM
jgi:phosphohistidine phosphatase SixA